MEIPLYGGGYNCGGDSGGPVVKNNIGYGMISSGFDDASLGFLLYFTGFAYSNCSVPGGSEWFYYDLQTALSMTSSQLIP